MMLKFKIQAAVAAAASFRSFSSSTLLKANRPSCTRSSKLIDSLEHHSVFGFPHCQSWCSPSFRWQWNFLPSPTQTKRESDEWVVESGQEEAMVNKLEEWMLKYRPVYPDGKEKIKGYLNFKKNFEYHVEAYDNGESKGINCFADQTGKEPSTMNTGLLRGGATGGHGGSADPPSPLKTPSPHDICPSKVNMIVLLHLLILEQLLSFMFLGFFMCLALFLGFLFMLLSLKKRSYYLG